MTDRFRASEGYELLPRSSLDSAHGERYASPKPNSKLRLASRLWPGFTLRYTYPRSAHLYRHRGSHRQLLRGLIWTLVLLLSLIFLLFAFTATFSPSYSSPPEHYQALQSRCEESSAPGRGNVNNEKVFIAASLYDYHGLLVGGDWANAVRELVQLLGPRNVHLSVYENDADEFAKASLERLGILLHCNVTLVSEHLPLEDIPLTTIPTGEKRLKRIAFLAEVRNRALRPLYANPSIRYDKLLFINDVIFNPIDAVNLLFSTNVDSEGRAQYDAACAMDFINPFKFYDTYATRDLEGFSMGIPFFPWFANVGESASRRDVLAQTDAVRVRSCWGGMTAFDAQWFQKNEDLNGSNVAGLQLSPLRFRYEEDPSWDASECCLIHADLTYLHYGRNSTTDTGIFANPYVRVAYDSDTLSWLPYTRRVERLYPFIHNLLTNLVGRPYYNPRRLEQPGDKIVEQVWKYDNSGGSSKSRATGGVPGGSYHEVTRVASPGQFCGSRKVRVLDENPEEGMKKWIPLPLPPS